MDHGSDAGWESLEGELTLAKLRAGDRDCFELVVAGYGAAVLDFAFRFLQDEDAAMDICQDTFVAAYQKIGLFDPRRGTLRSWLFGIAANLSLNELKRRKRASSPTVQARIADRLYGAASADARSGTDGEDVRRAVAALPPKDRQIILLSYYHDLSYREIADALSIPIGTVKSRMHQAVQRLRAVFLRDA